MASVEVHENESFDKALRRFRLECKKERIIETLKDNAYHQKPSAKKRQKMLQAQRKYKRRSEEEEA